MGSDLRRETAVCKDGLHNACSKGSTVQAAVLLWHRDICIDKWVLFYDVIGLIIIVSLLQLISFFPKQRLPDIDLKKRKLLVWRSWTLKQSSEFSFSITLMKSSMLRTLVSLFPFFSLSTNTSSMLAPTRWPMSARRVCSSDTEYTRLWQYCTISEKRSAKALRLTSVLGLVRGRSKMLDFPRVNLVSILCWKAQVSIYRNPFLAHY